MGHQAGNIEMADGSFQTVFYNGYTKDELLGGNRGRDGLEALGVDTMKPFITRGILIDVAGYKNIHTITSGLRSHDGRRARCAGAPGHE